MAARTILIYAERTITEPVRDPVLGSPQNRLVKGMAQQYIAERGSRGGLRLQLSLELPDEGHDMATCAGPVDAESAIAVTLCYATPGRPQDRPVMRVALLYIAERAGQRVHRLMALAIRHRNITASLRLHALSIPNVPSL